MKIPIYDNFQEAPGAGPTPNVSGAIAPNTAGLQAQQLGDGLQRAGGAVSQIANDIQTNINEARVKERDNNLSEVMRKTLSDPGGYLTKLGKDAVDGHEEVVKNLRKATEEIGTDLENDAQKRIFSDVAQRRLQSALGQVGAHAAQQTKVYAAGQASARADSAARDMVANWMDPKLFAAGRGTMLAEVRKLGQLQGFAPEQIKQAEEKALSAAHTGVLSHVLSLDRYKDAKDYFAAHRDEIDPAARDNIAKQLESAGVKDESLQRFLKLQGNAYPDQLRRADAAYEKGTISAEVHDALVSRIDHAESQRSRREADAKSANMGAAQEWILQNPGGSILDMPPQLYAWARSEGQLGALQSFARTGGDPITDTNLFYNLRTMAADPAQQSAFAKMNLIDIRPSFSRADFNSIVALQAAVRTQDAKGMEANATATRVLKLVETDLLAAGVDTTPGNNERDAEKLNTFRNTLLRAVDEKVKAKGSPLTDEEARKVGLDLLKEGTLQGTGILGMFQTKKRRFEVSADEQASTPFVGDSYSDIPPTSRTTIESFLRNRPDLWSSYGIERGPYGGPDMGNKNWRDAIERLHQGAQDAGVTE